ncbi:1-acyl-sn-glycerol-3-phosphate acyltransferase epsilon [Branchiostoma belcheri]|nr:1-acyl-sn-glycerol-3-phosphate acyltransferase epsilon [Branchiostoma belcheri]
MLSLIVHVRSLKYMVPCAMMLLPATPYFLTSAVLKLLSAALPRRWYRWGDDFMYTVYQSMVLFFFEHCTGVEVVLYGDDPSKMPPENIIYLSNHQCTVDWAVADMLAVRQGMLGHVRYVLKDGLRYLPLYGWYFRQHGCVYVKRGGNNEKALAKQIKDLNKTLVPTYMVIFPEGTRYNPEKKNAIQKSQGFAYVHGLEILEHVLTPRVKATELCLRAIGNNVTAVYDITVAYSTPDTHGRPRAPDMADYLMGQSRQIHIHLTRIPLQDIPQEQGALQDWLHGRFVEKDRMLKKFFSDDPEDRGHFEGKGRVSKLPLWKTVPSTLVLCAITLPFLVTKGGRDAYWKSCLGSIAFGWLWMAVTV